MKKGLFLQPSLSTGELMQKIQFKKQWTISRHFFIVNTTHSLVESPPKLTTQNLRILNFSFNTPEFFTFYDNHNFIAPQSFSGGGLVFKRKLVTMERVWWVTMERV